MNSDPRLIERAAENQAQSEYGDQVPSDNELVIDFEININYMSQIKYKNLEGDKQKLCDLEDLIEIENISEYFGEYDLTFSEDVKNELQILQQKLQEAKDDDLELYELSYRINQDGSSEFYIPMKTEYTEDWVVKTIYNSDSEFVANNIEDTISYPVYEIESKQYYVKAISERERIEVYSKRKQTFPEFINSLYTQSYENLLEDIKNSTLFTALIYIPFGLFHLVNLVELANFILVVSTVFFFFSIFGPLIMITCSTRYLICYVKYKESDTYTRDYEFEI
jgi:hypothetical protein